MSNDPFSQPFTVKFHIGEPQWNLNQKMGYEITKHELENRIFILSGIIQALIDRIGEKEGVKLSVIENASCRKGDSFKIIHIHSDLP